MCSLSCREKLDRGSCEGRSRSGGTSCRSWSASASGCGIEVCVTEMVMGAGTSITGGLGSSDEEKRALTAISFLFLLSALPSFSAFCCSAIKRSSPSRSVGRFARVFLVGSITRQNFTDPLRVPVFFFNVVGLGRGNELTMVYYSYL